MILIDRRQGSAELAPLFRPHGVPTSIVTLDYADFAFFGKGAKGQETAIGIERKTVGDLLSSFTSGRLSGHQLPGLCDSYGWVWLIVEGSFRPCPQSGVLQTYYGGGWKDAGRGPNRIMYAAVDHYITTLETKAAVRVRRTFNEAETVKVLVDLYKWWTQKDWDQHRSHLALDTLDARDSTLMLRPSVARNICAQLPGVGWLKSAEVEQHFKGSVRAMVMATAKEWAEVKGIGKTLAGRIVEVLK